MALMKSLLIDTSSHFLILALIEGSDLLHSEIAAHQNNLSKTLFTSIQDCLAKQNWTLKDLDTIATGIGPGSYTGTRIGAAVASALSFALDIPIKTFPSPLIFVPNQEGPFAYLMPTKTGSYFSVKGTIRNGTFSDIAHERIATEPTDTNVIVHPSPDQHPSLDLLIPYIHAQQHTTPDNIELLYLHII